MMSTVGAGSAPDTAAAPVLGDAWASTGAAGLFDGDQKSAQGKHAFCWRMLTAEVGTSHHFAATYNFNRFWGEADIGP
jgi:hypothetical protein